MNNEITVSQFIASEKAYLDAFFDWMLSQSKKSEKGYVSRHTNEDWLTLLTSFKTQAEPFSFREEAPD